MYLNSYVLATDEENTAADRAKFLGHSVRTNLEHYTFEDRAYVDKLSTTIERKVPKLEPTLILPVIIDFDTKKRTLQTANS